MKLTVCNICHKCTACKLVSATDPGSSTIRTCFVCDGRLFHHWDAQSFTMKRQELGLSLLRRKHYQSFSNQTILRENNSVRWQGNCKPKPSISSHFALNNTAELQNYGVASGHSPTLNFISSPPFYCCFLKTVQTIKIFNAIFVIAGRVRDPWTGQSSSLHHSSSTAMPFAPISQYQEKLDAMHWKIPTSGLQSSKDRNLVLTTILYTDYWGFTLKASFTETVKCLSLESSFFQMCYSVVFTLAGGISYCC